MRRNATGVRRICGYHGFVLLGLLPFLNMMGMGYAYAALPLHFLDMGWSLPALGAAATIGPNVVYEIPNYWHLRRSGSGTCTRSPCTTA